MDVTYLLAQAYATHLGPRVNDSTWVALWAEYNLQRAEEPDVAVAADLAARQVARDGL